MKNLFLVTLLVFAGACSSLAPSAGNKQTLNNERSNSTNTIVFGRIIDKNPQSVKEKLQITYTLSKEPTGGIFGSDTAFPNMDPETNYFWVSIPTKDANYFGIRSIRFQISGTDAVAIIKDELHNKPLFGTSIESKKGAKYIYVGDITIRSGVKKSGAGLNFETFDIKEAFNKKDAASAKNYIEDRGFDSKNLLIMPLDLRKI